jgi:hypothetical protein
MSFLKNLKDGGGVSFFQDRHLPIPLLNYSKGNKALTSNLVILNNFKIPIGLLELIFLWQRRETRS